MTDARDPRDTDEPVDAADAPDPAEQGPEAAASGAQGPPPAASPDERADGGLPQQTRDDTDVGWGRDPDPLDAHDRWLLEQRPPHWD